MKYDHVMNAFLYIFNFNRILDSFFFFSFLLQNSTIVYGMIIYNLETYMYMYVCLFVCLCVALVCVCVSVYVYMYVMCDDAAIK